MSDSEIDANIARWDAQTTHADHARTIGKLAAITAERDQLKEQQDVLVGAMAELNDEATSVSIQRDQLRDALAKKEEYFQLLYERSGRLQNSWMAERDKNTEQQKAIEGFIIVIQSITERCERLEAVVEAARTLDEELVHRGIVMPSNRLGDAIAALDGVGMVGAK